MLSSVGFGQCPINFYWTSNFIGHEFNNLKYVYMKERRCKQAKKDSRTMVDKNEIRNFIFLQIIL